MLFCAPASVIIFITFQIWHFNYWQHETIVHQGLKVPLHHLLPADNIFLYLKLKMIKTQETFFTFGWLKKQQHFYLKQIFCLEILISACFLADILLDLRVVSVSF